MHIHTHAHTCTRASIISAGRKNKKQLASWVQIPAAVTVFHFILIPMRKLWIISSLSCYG